MALDTEKLTAELEALQKQRQLVSESLRSLNGRGRGRGAFGHHQVGGGRFGGRGGPRGPWGGSGREPEGDGSEAQGPRGLGDSTGRVSREAPSGRAEPGKEEGQQPRQWREAAADRTGSGTGHAWRRADGLVGRCWQPAAAAERGGEAGPGAGLESSRAAGRGLGGPWGGGTEQRGRAREAAAGAKDAAGAPAARKRLLSAVVAPDGSLPPDEAEAGEWQTEQNEAKRQKRAEMEAAPDMQKRNRRMFGALLGTLSSFRKEASDFSSSSSAQRQHAALQRAEARRRKLSQEAAAAARLEMEEKRNQHHDVLRKLNLDADKKRLELQYAHRIAHEKALLAFCRTKTRPAVFWLPVEVKEDSAAAEQLHRQRAAWPQQQAALVEALEREKMKLEEAAREWRKRRLQHLSQRNAARAAAAADAGAAADAAPPPSRATRHENTRPAPEPGSRRSQSGEDSDADGDELLPTVDMEVEPEADDDAPDEGGDHDEQLHDPAAAAAAAEDRYRPDAAGNPDSDGADADDHQTDP